MASGYARYAASRACIATLAASGTSMSVLMFQSPWNAEELLTGRKVQMAAPAPDPPATEATPKPRSDAPRTSAVGFDPEALERGATALREINASAHAKKVFDLMKKQEETRQTEENARRAEFQALQAQHETERQRVIYDEQKKLVQQQAQSKAQLARYEDELARKRMQADHEAQRVRNVELVKLQEESAARQEQLRRSTEENIQALRRQTEKERAEIERETIRAKALAEAEGRAVEARMIEDVNKRMLVERGNMEKEKWLAAINSTFKNLGSGIEFILTDREKLGIAIVGTTVLAAGVYFSREGARVLWNYVGQILGQPSLVRETSRGKLPWTKWLSARQTKHLTTGPSSSSQGSTAVKAGLGEIILPGSLMKRIQQVASFTAGAKKFTAPYRNMLFYGPPGTGKTMAAKELARGSGLEYAIMTGGDVAPLGSNAVTRIHELFDWAGRTRKGLLLFIDEADAFLCKRNSTQMSESQRSALNAFLYRTGELSHEVVLVLATNRPGDLDTAVADRIDEILEFDLPGLEERIQLIKLYLGKYILQAGVRRGWKTFLLGPSGSIEVKGISDDSILQAARRTEGFSGREIAKLMASLQGAIYGSNNLVLDPLLFAEVVDYKVDEHHRRNEIWDNTQKIRA